MSALAGGLLFALGAGVSAVGYGSAIARLLRIRPALGDLGILGLLGLASAGCIAHFLTPLSVPLQIVVLAIGLVLAAAFRRDILAGSLSIGLFAVAGLIAFVFVRPQAVDNYDYGLYYLQTFKWNREFPIVAGLGNLHSRLAYNSAIFLLAPLVDRSEWGWIANCLAVVFLLLALLARARQSNSMTRWFVAFALIVFAIKPGWLNWLGLMQSDALGAVLILYWVALALSLADAPHRPTAFALLLLSAVLAVLTKVSMLPLLALTAVLFWIHRRERPLGVAVGLFAAVALGAWMLRGIWLSGCAVYPIQQTCLSDLAWARPPAGLQEEQLAIRAWARAPDQWNFAGILSDWQWFWPWATVAWRKRLVQLMTAGILLGLVARLTGARKVRHSHDDLTVLAAGLAVSMGFWFWSAPDLRFGQGFIVAAGLLGWSFAASVWLTHARWHSYGTYFLVLLMVLSGVRNLWQLDEQSFVATIPAVNVYQFKAGEDMRIWVPRIGDRCWEHELPCSPYLDRAALARVRWPVAWEYRYQPEFAPPAGWEPSTMHSPPPTASNAPGIPPHTEQAAEGARAARDKAVHGIQSLE